VPFCRQTPLTLKALRPKDYSEDPQTIGQHLKRRRRELGLLQREASERMGVPAEIVANWENGKTEPVAVQFQPVVVFLGYDPTPESKTLAERLGTSLAQIARHLGWDPGSLRRYLDGTWGISPDRRTLLEAFLNAKDEALVGLRSLKRRR
jgi:transcriptional regulator with XRE-family HTH domain